MKVHKKQSLFILFFLTFGSVCCISHVDSITCIKSEIQGEETSMPNMLTTLIAWCAEDPICSYEYRIDKLRGGNNTVFAYLARKALSRFPNLNSPLDGLICQHEGQTLGVLRELWTLILTHERRIGIMCDHNHDLVLNSDGVTVSCACNVNSTCNDAVYNTAFFTILVILLFIMATMIFITSLQRTLQERERIRENKKRS